jgi:predicted  nucleic acid-binding Zn-ribbon protein
MKKSLIALCITCALSLAAYADDDNKAEAGKKHEAKPEQKATRKALIEKYDTNKDGKLDKEERAKVSEEDKAKLKEARGNAVNATKKEKSNTAK